MQILFGAGWLSELPVLINGRHTVLVTTRRFTRRGITALVNELLRGVRLHMLDTVQLNPGLCDIERDWNMLQRKRIDIVVVLAGGSALDTAQAVSFLLSATTRNVLRQHFELGIALWMCLPYW